MSDTVIGVTGLAKNYGALRVTDDVSFTLARGARHGLIGPNGAGKTTLVGLLAGTVAPSAGTIELAGRNITHASQRARVKGGLVRTFQINNLFRELTLLENLYLAASEYAAESTIMWRAAGKRQSVVENAERVLQTLHLEDDVHCRVAELSYGKQRLVELAIALALRPRVLLLDEPAAGIPSNEISIVLDALERLPPDIAVLMIEHDMFVVRRFARNVTVLVEGAIVMTGSCDDVMSSDEVHRVYLGNSGRARLQADARDA